MTLGRSIRLFLVDGTPNGLLTAEIMNWTGHVLTGPRSKLVELLQRPECSRTGVYFLVGPDPENNQRSKVYIGESDNVVRHLEQHNRPEEQGGKDFWERVCLVTSKEQSLTRAHVRDLERRLIGLVMYANRCELVNGPANDEGILSEADCSDMMFFLEHIYAVLPVLGYDFLAPISEAPASPGAIEPPLLNAPQPHTARQIDDAAPEGGSESPLFKLEVHEHKLLALAKVVDGRFTVLKGSQSLHYMRDTAGGHQKLYNQLVDSGVLVPDGDLLLTFTEDQVFSSPRAAASVVCGHPVDGRAAWLVSDTDQTYATWQSQQPSGSARISYSSDEEWLSRVQ